MEEVFFTKTIQGEARHQKALVIHKSKVFAEACTSREDAERLKITWDDCSIAYDTSDKEFIWFVYHSGTKAMHMGLDKFPYMSRSVESVVTDNSKAIMDDLSKRDCITFMINGKTLSTHRVPERVMNQARESEETTVAATATVPSKKRKRPRIKEGDEVQHSSPLGLLGVNIKRHCADVKAFINGDTLSRDYRPKRGGDTKLMIPLGGDLFEYVRFYITKKCKDLNIHTARGETPYLKLPPEMRRTMFDAVPKPQNDDWASFHAKMTEYVMKKKKEENDPSALARFESFIKTALSLYGPHI